MRDEARGARRGHRGARERRRSGVRTDVRRADVQAQCEHVHAYPVVREVRAFVPERGRTDGRRVLG
jgi:hypothetical protein